MKDINKDYPISKPHVYKILDNMRYIIAHYLKETYNLEKITELNKHDNISVDESLFVHINNQQLWVVGIINNNSREIRLEIVENRSAETMKKIITTLIPKGNRIITDAAACYNWLNDPDSGYEHSVHNHGHGNFGEGMDSTSHIEQLWHNIKQNITSIYKIIPSENFVLYLKESEFRRNTKKFSKVNVLTEFESICAYVYNVAGTAFYDSKFLSKLTADSF
jgi:transposase-like protein